MYWIFQTLFALSLIHSEQWRAQSVPGVFVSERSPSGAASFPWCGAACSVPAPCVRGVQTGPAAGPGTGQRREALLWLAVCKAFLIVNLDPLLYWSLSMVVVWSTVCRNKNSMESLSRLVIHPHQGSVYSACFSHDGTKIASSGACKTLKVSAVSLSQFNTHHCIKSFIHSDCRVTVLYRGV